MYVCMCIYEIKGGEERPELQFHRVLTLLIKDAADVGQVDTVIIGEGEQLKG